MSTDIKTDQFGFSENMAYLSVHTRFRINDALSSIIEQIHGIEWVNVDGKYSMNVGYGKMFSSEEIRQLISDKINDFLADNQ